MYQKFRIPKYHIFHCGKYWIQNVYTMDTRAHNLCILLRYNKIVYNQFQANAAGRMTMLMTAPSAATHHSQPVVCVCVFVLLEMLNWMCAYIVNKRRWRRRRRRRRKRKINEHIEIRLISKRFWMTQLCHAFYHIVENFQAYIFIWSSFQICIFSQSLWVVDVHRFSKREKAKEKENGSEREREWEM